MSKLDQNRLYAKNLGWQPKDFGASVNDFTPTIVAAIQQTQAALGVANDGVAGPKTYAALLAAKQAELVTTPSCDPLRDAGIIALYELKRHWMIGGGVIDLPPENSPLFEHSRNWIDEAIRSPIGLDWGWEALYRLNRFEWCGAAVARAWQRAGMKMSIRRSFFSSTYRLDRWSDYRPFNETTPNPRPSQGPYRRVVELDERSTASSLSFGWQMGDILLVGSVSSAYGNHITLVESFDPATLMFTTIEGNGTGLGPDGKSRHGIVRAQRPLGLIRDMSPKTYHARRLIRPALADLVR